MKLFLDQNPVSGNRIYKRILWDTSPNLLGQLSRFHSFYHHRMVSYLQTQCHCSGNNNQLDKDCTPTLVGKNMYPIFTPHFWPNCFVFKKGSKWAMWTLSLKQNFLNISTLLWQTYFLQYTWLDFRGRGHFRLHGVKANFKTWTEPPNID